MSDVSKTREELIAEAREATTCICVEAPEIECGAHGDDHSKLVAALADALFDALEAATRVPVQGGPNADREAHVKRIILESLVFTNENSEPWAQLLAENILAALDGAPEPLSTVMRLNTLLGINVWEAPSFRADVRVDFDEVGNVLRAAVLDGAPEPGRMSIPIPNVPFGPEGVAPTIATASYLIEVVKKLDFGYANVGGSNVTATLRKLLVDTAEALRGLPVEGGISDAAEA